jgi:outer membrane protein assembly factor BamE (lipoprotein component of BamABCDE complex)
MFSPIKFAFSFAVIAALLGCAGTNFVRPDSENLKNGQTTYVQIVARMGEPRREGTLIKNDKTIKSAAYAYASVGGKALNDGVTAARAMVFYFYNDTLVGHEFVSSWADDNTDFDESKMNQIVKGKTTRIELSNLLGKPSGYQVAPLIKAASGEAAVYVYAETRSSSFNLKLFRKVLAVTFDNAGIVTDVEFVSSGSK